MIVRTARESSPARPLALSHTSSLLLGAVALAAALGGDAVAARRLKRECRELCQPYRELCIAQDRRGRRRLYRLCWKNLQQSCRLSATQSFPPAPTCTFPCGTDADCSFGRKCVQLQCIIPPVFSRGGDDPNDDGGGQCLAAFPVACSAGYCCPPGGICNTVDPSVCCSTQFPVSCSGTCCPEGATCRSDGRCCTPGAPVECPNVCCRSGYTCGPNDTCTPDGGGTDCSCRCDDGSVCTSHADCGVDSYGIPNVCGCPVSPPCDGHGNGG